MNRIEVNFEIKQIYYKYFYQNTNNRTFKSFVFYPIVIEKILKIPELISFLDILDEVKNDFDDKDYIIDNIHKFRFIVNLTDKYFDTFNIFLLLLKEVEKKEFFFNGIDEYKINSNINFLTDMYYKKNYHLKEEKEFSTYNLIEIMENRRLFWQEPRIIDDKYQITFDVKYINKNIYNKIYELHKSQNFKLSFYPDCLNIKDYIDLSIMTYDEKEFGKNYNINECKTMSLKANIKFVDYIEKNKLYIKLFNNELTFEEIQINPKFFDGLDVIYTKVIHLIFFVEDDNLYIKHVDLEYIFYSLDEYIERFENDNFEQKGNRMKRQKIFKIDNAKINLIEELYHLVYYSLDNKNLINEYFKMLNES